MKKILFILLIILCLITTALFPLDLFVAEVPEWVIYACIAAVIAVTVLIFAIAKPKLPMKIISVCLAAAVTLASFAGVWLDPYFNGIFLRHAAPTLPYDTQLSADDACADLDYAMKYLLKNHPMLMNGLPDDMREKYDAVKSDIKAAGSITVCELHQKTETIFSMLGDAHTSVGALYAAPLYLKHWHRLKNDGYSITALNGITIKELLTQKADLFSFEAESWELESLKNNLPSVQGLSYLGFNVSEGITYTFVNNDGEELDETYGPDDFVTYEEYLKFNNIDNTVSDNGSFVSFTVDEEKSLALLTLTECNYNDEYINCLHDMFTQVKEKGIKNVAVDLRDNGGGNDRVAVEFIRYLDTAGYKYASETQRLGFFTTPVTFDFIVNDRYTDLTFTGNVYILTSAGSFSSAMLFPQYIKDNALGTIIGEPPGNDPNGCGEITRFRMPNSGLQFYVSTKRFYRADKECKDKYVMPDIECDADTAIDVLYETIST